MRSSCGAASWVFGWRWAQPRDVLRLILGKGMQLAGMGLALGLVATLAAGRALSSMLYQVSWFNPLTLG